MRRITLPIVGAGTPDDPRRVDLPTYQLVSEDTRAGTFTVDVPDADFPLAPDFQRPPSVPGRPVPVDLERVAVADLDAWHDHLDERYVEHAGRFRPAPTRRAR